MPDSSPSCEARSPFARWRASAHEAGAHLARFHALPRRDKRRLVALSLVVPAIDVSLDVFRFQRVRGALERHSSTAVPLAATPRARADAHRLAELAAIAGRRGLVRSNCLPQSLAVWWWLRREGLPVRLRIGTTGSHDAFSAHAWVELDGVALGQPEPHHRAFDGL